MTCWCGSTTETCRYRFVGVRGRHNLETSFFDHLGRISDQELILDDEHDGSAGCRVPYSSVLSGTYRNAKCSLSFPNRQK